MGRLIRALVLGLLLPAALAGAAEEAVPLAVGATAYPHAGILEAAREELREAGYELEIVRYRDYVMPNVDLAEGRLFANFFQHAPYMERVNRNWDLDLCAVARVHLEPMGLYSLRFKTVSELRPQAVIGVPDDPSNLARALLLLEEHGLLELKAAPVPSLADITANPRGIRLQPMPSPALIDRLEKLDGAVINANYAGEINLFPRANALICETVSSPFANVLVVRRADAGSPPVRALIRALHSAAVRDYINLKLAPRGIYPVF